MSRRSSTKRVTRATAHLYIESPLRDHAGLRVDHQSALGVKQRAGHAHRAVGRRELRRVAPVAADELAPDIGAATNGSALSTTPNAGDGHVYQDEFVNWLKVTRPNANLIFSVQEVDPKDLPGQPSSDKPGGITIFDQGLMTYTGWLAVENAATALADASTLLMQPGLRCENGRLAPITEPDWIRFTDRTLTGARRMYRLAQMRNSEAISEFTLELSNSCNACHQVYRNDGGRGRGAPIYA